MPVGLFVPIEKAYPRYLVQLKEWSRGMVFSGGKAIYLQWNFTTRETFICCPLFDEAKLLVTDRINKSNEPVVKPNTIVDYCKYMGGVDVNDQICQYYDVLRKCVKWWKKLFFHLLTFTSYIGNMETLQSAECTKISDKILYVHWFRKPQMHLVQVKGKGERQSQSIGSEEDTFHKISLAKKVLNAVDQWETVKHVMYLKMNEQGTNGIKLHFIAQIVIYLCVFLNVLSCIIPKNTINHHCKQQVLVNCQTVMTLNDSPVISYMYLNKSMVIWYSFLH